MHGRSHLRDGAGYRDGVRVPMALRGRDSRRARRDAEGRYSLSDYGRDARDGHDAEDVPGSDAEVGRARQGSVGARVSAAIAEAHTADAGRTPRIRRVRQATSCAEAGTG